MILIKSIAVLLLIAWDSTVSEGNEIVLPDGRTIDVPDPKDYTYHLKRNMPANGTITRTYILVEVIPNSAFLCPKGYFIAKISQELIINSSQSSGIPIENTKQRNASFENYNGEKIGPCPTLFQCLGFQACLFKFGNEFCHKDPAPNLRKSVLVLVDCHKDNHEASITQRSNKVLHLRYKSRLESREFIMNRNYSATEIFENSINEDEVFEASCPDLHQALQLGYDGDCMTPNATRADIVEQVWTLLGRTRSQRCRSELLQVFCSFQYNPNGSCIPPLFLEQDRLTGRKFNFKSLPYSSHQDMNTIHYSPDTIALVPARVGFILLLHQNVETSVQLIESVWRPHNFYVIHVDRRSRVFKKNLQETLSFRQLLQKGNIKILPDAKSFATSWGSYQIVRAQLEAMEELLRMGYWDFAINLSGADLPIRDVDDLAASLAPHRGKSFLPFTHWKNDPATDFESDKLAKDAFYSCDDYVFKVASTAGMPQAKNFEIYNSPQWGVFAREFVEYLVDERKRSEKINSFQYYLQTHVIPDESYLPTILMNSPFRKTLRLYAVHTTKEFASENIDHLCRHFTDADFCGQGPGLYDENDRSELMSFSHRSFFARKFSPDASDDLRMFALGLTGQGYDAFKETFLPVSVQRTLADIAVSHLASTTLRGQDIMLTNVTSTRILPSLVAHDPCCHAESLLLFRKITDHHLWLDFHFKIGTGRHHQFEGRASFEPVSNGRVCYADGDLKMAFLSSWASNTDFGAELNRDAEKSHGLLETMPFPFGPAGVQKVTVTLVLAGNTSNFSCQDEFTSDGSRPIHVGKSEKEIKLLLYLLDPEGILRCVQNKTVFIEHESAQNSSDHEDSLNSSIFSVSTFVIDCGGKMEHGPWLLQIAKDEPTFDSRVYSVPFYLLDYGNEMKMYDQLNDMANLWRIQDIVVFDSESRKQFHNEVHMNTNGVFNKASKKILMYETTTHSMSDMSFSNVCLLWRWLWHVIACYGGIMFVAALSVSVHFLYCSIRIQHLYVYYYLAVFAVASVFQAIVLLSSCDSEETVHLCQLKKH